MARRYRGLAAAIARRDERHQLTLARLADWPQGMPPLSGIGSDIGTLVGLEREGLAERLPQRDECGDLRFRLTDAGRQALGGT